MSSGADNFEPVQPAMAMRAALEALENQGRMLQAVLDNMPAGVFMVEAPTGRPILSNRRAEELLGRGISPDAIGDELNQIYGAYVAGTDQLYPSEQMPVVAGLHGRFSTIDDMEVRRPDGSSVLLEINGVPVHDALGRIVASIVVFQDITGRSRAEQELRRHREQLEQLVAERTAELTRINQELRREIAERSAVEVALRESEARFRAVVEQAGDALYVIDMSGRIISVNLRSCQDMGYAQEEMLRLSVADIDAQYTVEQAQALWQTMQTGSPILLETLHRRKDGSTFPVEVRAGTVELGGEQMILSLARDITVRKQMQELLIQSEKMMTVGGLAAGVAHEINNPLAAIVQNAQVVLNRISPDLPANQRAAERCGTAMSAISAYMNERGIAPLLGSIRDSGERAARILRNMLGFSRTVHAAPMVRHDLRILLDQTVDLAASDYDLRHKGFSRIRIVREYSADLPLVSCDATEIQQVVLNLLKNAADAMAGPDGRSEPPCLVLRLTHSAAGVRIEVKDNGPGMAEPVLRRVFEPFFTTKPQGAGTGLGLFVSYYIITRIHGGTMAAESTPGQGSRFSITLPLERREDSWQSVS